MLGCRRDRLQELLSEKVLARNAMDITKIQGIREEMERVEARKLQPHFIGSFFIEAFQHLGGVIRLFYRSANSCAPQLS
ncbi:MAG: hypothetical protein ACRC80_26845 [Waterburya sp.]